KAGSGLGLTAFSSTARLDKLLTLDSIRRRDLAAMRRRRGLPEWRPDGRISVGPFFFALKLDPRRQPNIAAGERREVLELARMPARIDVEQIVAGQREGQLRARRERVPVERGVDHRVAPRWRLVRRGLVLARHALDLHPTVDLTTRAGQTGEHAERRDFGGIPEMLDSGAD